MKRFIILVVLATIVFAGGARGQWVQTNGPEGGPVNCFVTLDSSLLVGTNGGVFRSYDHGLSWIHSSQGLPPGAFVFAFSSDQNILFANVGNTNIYRSLDHGVTWNESDDSVQGVWCVLAANGTVFAGSDGGVFYSNDSGSHWYLAYPYLCCVGALAANGSTIFAGSYTSGVWRTQASGVAGSSWRPINNHLTTHGVASIVESNGYLFANTWDGLIIRLDGDDTNWVVVDTGLSGSSSLIVAGGILYAIGGQASYASPDNGKTWQVAKFPTPPIRSGVYSTDTNLFIGTLGGVFKSGDSGITWQEANNGLYASEINALYAYDSLLLAATEGNGIWETTDRGSYWQKYYTGLPTRNIFVIGRTGNTLLVGTDSGVFRSSDIGRAWVPVNDSLPAKQIAILGVKDSEVFVSANALDRRGLYRTMTSTWKWVESDDGISNSIINCVFFGSSGILVGTDSGVFRSIDGGQSWNNSSDGMPTGTMYLSVYDFTCIGNKIFAGTEYGIFVSTDDGISWKAAGPALGGAVTVFRQNNAVVAVNWFTFFTSPDSIFFSYDTGATWAVVCGPPSAFVGVGANPLEYPLAIDSAFVFAGTNSNGVWRRPLSDFGISSVSPQPPPLSQDIYSYPNPFPDRTEISFTSQTAGYADISIVNILGAPVAHLFSGELGAGNHSFTWEAHGAAPGSYWCIIRMGGRVERVGLLRE